MCGRLWQLILSNTVRDLAVGGRLRRPQLRATYRLATYVPSSAPLTTSSADTDANADGHADARATRRLLPMPLLRLPPLVPRLSSYLQPRVRVL